MKETQLKEKAASADSVEKYKPVELVNREVNILEINTVRECTRAQCPGGNQDGDL